MKYYIIAGEASGDLHGSNLIRELKINDPAAIIRCWGGELMQKAGADLVTHYRDLAFMGFTEVLKNIGTILSNIKTCKKDISKFKPDVLILIDYPGFNLRIAAWAKLHDLKVVYYISPQVWAWKESRVNMMKKCIDKMIVILPFEKDFFKIRWNWDVDYVGHPLVEVVDDWLLKNEQTILSDKPIVAILPGSRKQEIAKKLPVMLEVSTSFPNHQFIVAKAPGLEDRFYDQYISSYPNVSTVTNETYNLLAQSKAALVTSGTATLETALFRIPEVVCYKGSPISYQIAKRLIKIKYISLVNLIMDKMVVKELIQQHFSIKNLREELQTLLADDAAINTMKIHYNDLRKKLKYEGHASANAAKLITDFISY